MVHTLLHGNAIEVLKTLADKSVDSVCTDPPYPQVKRSYGIWTEADWSTMMDTIIVELRRVLKPTGSAMFVLQPNSKTIGSMRPWFYEFMAKYAKEWGIVQDCWWWNPTAMPTTHCARHNGLMRPSVKALVWLGSPDCYRNQDKILWTSSFANKYNDLEDRALKKYPSGSSMRRGRCIQTSLERGGSTPFNLFPIGSGSKKRHGSKHGATTPLALCEQMVKYLTPPGGVVLDPFSGVATFGVAAIRNGFHYIGIEKHSEFFDEAQLVMEEEQTRLEQEMFR
jgi:DNA modification methylase